MEDIPTQSIGRESMRETLYLRRIFQFEKLTQPTNEIVAKTKGVFTFAQNTRQDCKQSCPR